MKKLPRERYWIYPLRIEFSLLLKKYLPSGEAAIHEGVWFSLTANTLTSFALCAKSEGGKVSSLQFALTLEKVALPVACPDVKFPFVYLHITSLLPCTSQAHPLGDMHTLTSDDSIDKYFIVMLDVK